MKTRLLNGVICGATATVWSLGVAVPVFAEGHQDLGSGAHGVNRVIRTGGDPFDAASPTGYIGARGSVSISFSMPTNSENILTPQTNPHDNKPSAYFGAQGPAAAGAGAGEVDAGFQFETGVPPEEIAGVSPEEMKTRPLPVVGWTPFISQGDNFLIIRVYDPVTGRPMPWRGSGSWAGGSGSIDTNLEFAVTLPGDPNNVDGVGGGIKLTASGLGTVYWNQNALPVGADPSSNPLIPSATNPVAPWRAQTVFNISNPNRINVKRVVAMTRRGAAAADLDGSSMNATFTGCEVRRTNQAWIDWASSAMRHTTRELRNQEGGVVGRVSGTGYDAPANGAANDGAWDRRVTTNSGTFKTPTSRTIVEFPSLTVKDGNTTRTGQSANIAGREDDAASYGATQGRVSRYNTETVNINLGTVTKPVGKAVELP